MTIKFINPILQNLTKTVIKEENMSKKHKHISATKTTEQKAVQQSQQPQELTPQKLNRLLEKNPFAQLLAFSVHFQNAGINRRIYNFLECRNHFSGGTDTDFNRTLAYFGEYKVFLLHSRTHQ